MADQKDVIPPRSSKRKPFLPESEKEDPEKMPYPRNRLRANTVGWSGKTQLINVPNSAGSVSSGSSTPEGASVDLNVEKSNAYFKRLSTLPEKRPTFKQRNKITHVSRKLLFAFSEMYSALKRFNVIGSTESAVQERMAMMLAMAKRQINNFVEVLENIEGKELDADSSPESMLRAFRKNIQVFKEILSYMNEHLSLFTDKVDVCFIRMLLLSVFGCLSEIYNASASLGPEKRAAVQLAQKQLYIPTASKSQLAGARISVVDPKDQKLYASSQSAITTAKRVCTAISETMNKHYSSSNISGHVAAEELLFKCNQTQEYARKLDMALSKLTKSVFDHQHVPDSFDKFVVEQEKYKRIFLSNFDGFITTVIRILALFKLLMKDFPELMNLRGEMSLLSRVAKELIALFTKGTGAEFKGAYGGKRGEET